MWFLSQLLGTDLIWSLKHSQKVMNSLGFSAFCAVAAWILRWLLDGYSPALPSCTEVRLSVCSISYHVIFCKAGVDSFRTKGTGQPRDANYNYIKAEINTKLNHFFGNVSDLSLNHFFFAFGSLSDSNRKATQLQTWLLFAFGKKRLVLEKRCTWFFLTQSSAFIVFSATERLVSSLLRMCVYPCYSKTYAVQD